MSIITKYTHVNQCNVYLHFLLYTFHSYCHDLTWSWWILWSLWGWADLLTWQLLQTIQKTVKYKIIKPQVQNLNSKNFQIINDRYKSKLGQRQSIISAHHPVLNCDVFNHFSQLNFQANWIYKKNSNIEWVEITSFVPQYNSYAIIPLKCIHLFQ
jgi:hypothetical protein